LPNPEPARKPVVLFNSFEFILGFLSAVAELEVVRWPSVWHTTIEHSRAFRHGACMLITLRRS
jgi:hypothetical protein